MFATTDTIAAIATPAGRGGIGVVRVSGPDAQGVASRVLDIDRPLLPRHATLTRVVIHRDATQRPGASRPSYLDQVIATFFPEPRSYTGEDVVEISAHGSPVILREIVATAMMAGARLAEPGEFTLRAFLSGRMDLIQAEAVADLVDAVTPRQARVAFDQLEGTLTERIGEIDARIFDLIARMEASIDFPEEGYHFLDPDDASRELGALATSIDGLLGDGRRGRLIREGRQVAIVGKPNVGKSSLFNYLVGADRAIVTAHPGTTRDLVTEIVDVNGLVVTLVDTAGIRATTDLVEREGVRRARGALDVADFALLMLDRSRSLDADDRALVASFPLPARLVVINKIDLPPAWNLDDLESRDGVIEVSLREAQNLETLRTRLADALGEWETPRDDAAISNLRHLELLERARAAVGRALDMVNRPTPQSEELLLVDLQDAKGALEEITGRRTSEDTLRHIFDRFCIGK
ncbi:MAG: tRNA uridine-5-carboxymethylaminomethyl(34) synthesis GTPase MnmE [Acidobacteria bacterium]|nr:tRNA uridine-5-carboxymethylaminomethyl(34) synthesis GTPase MnmE [Acidobacteriota bacterium]MBI3262983.1 tRNA uridine-5-carboxymethylaminomethyl(34) synthesis GTPase MnmE [Acidobacteriota bacterium]